MLLALLFWNLTGCQDLWRNESDPTVLARVGEHLLYSDQVLKHMPKGLTGRDSLAYIQDQVNVWATRELLFAKAQLNLPAEKLAEYDALVSEYRADLYTRAYKEAMVEHSADTIITPSELEDFYEAEKENFKLHEQLVQLRFVALPQQFMNVEEVTKRLRRFESEDVKYLDSVGVQFLKLNFNDSLWVPVSRVLHEIPALKENNIGEYLNQPNFFELQDENTIYLAQVLGVKEVNDIAPLSYVEPTIRLVLLNRRKMRFLRTLETDLLNEATERKEFEIYD